MVWIQIELNEKQDEIVSIYKIKNKLKTKAEAITKLIDECGAKIESTQTDIRANKTRTPNNREIYIDFQKKETT